MQKTQAEREGLVEARLYDKAEKKRTDCYLCNFHCKISDGRFGVCGVRQNIGGTLYTHVYGKLISHNVDPVEKKPLFHFQPASKSYSISTVGCNFRCLHCQNFEISQMPKDRGRIIGEDMTAEEVVAEAYETGCSNIAYTYTEPTIFFEFAQDTGELARKKGLKNVFVTNGYMTRECLDELRGTLHGANVDVKSFSESTYKKVCGARLAPVLDSVEYMRSQGVWVEVTTLIIPTINDTPEELTEIAKWIAGVDKAIPWHISAFYPSYRMKDLPPTGREIIERARDIGLSEGLRYVYTGNIPGLKGESTFCYQCGELLIERYGFMVAKNLVTEGSTCPNCAAEIDGVEL